MNRKTRSQNDQGYDYKDEKQLNTAGIDDSKVDLNPPSEEEISRKQKSPLDQLKEVIGQALR